MKLSAINETKLQALRLNLQDQMEEINTIFNQLDENMNNIKNSMSGDSDVIVSSKISEIREVYPVFKSNLNSIVNDLENVVSGYKSLDEEVSSNLTKNIEKLNIDKE